MAMAERRNVEFGVEGGVTLRGWLFVPGAKGPAPMVQSAGTSTLGSRSPIGGARFRFSRASPKLMPLILASGAPAMPGATLLCSVLPTGV
jgi:hypothetical protein